MYFTFAQTQSYIASVLEHLIPATSPPPPPPPRSPDSPPRIPGPSSSPDGLLSKVDIFILPDHVSLHSAVAQLAHTPIMAGAQDAHHEDRGAYTGFVSPAVLAEVGCRIVELGHAERRRILGETDADAARKAAAVARNGMVPLVCIGEKTRPPRAPPSGEGDADAAAVAAAVAECAAQVKAVFSAVPETAEVILAYEPVWAIGAASPAAPGHVTGVVRGIRALPCVSDRGRGTTRILYGGSAGPGLFAKLKGGGVDGLFLGRFAHDPAQFVRTVREVAEA
ncbi:hypothetical protein DL766_005365 [Monosporascus sp. MC13-8B]|uniref:Triosephosphate isomerase n=1 Tax=Monosporascus cannonballus TaxID=155416 RepID=A0ABY0HGJ3_9PEZI|nr:hypothetical protein DL762_001333 [Monosporascus cannonballus]RYP00380.1 hypothetical protein DL763_000846 [Monosporascus cannonballus]RYP29470.1 hypothetical protein DL766_005365 [Monosporascus sp. MC13-8B]